MQSPGYNTGNTVFTESEWYPFRIHNLVQLQDDAWYYVLEDSNGLKHFMTAEYYKEYGFNIGDVINCKIDRINCTGRIFLEPKHPCYNEGEYYYFDLIKFPNHSNEYSVLVREISGKIVEVPLNSVLIVGLNEQKRVRCYVKSIKKGVLILEIHPDYT